jgi:hypothetical protein
VAILYRLLCVLIVVRVLCPPGVCVCKLSTRPVGVLANLFTGTEVPPLPPEEEDDHDPGCPCSPLSTALGLRPSDVPLHAVVFVAPSFDLAPYALILSPFDTAPRLPLAWPAEAHLYLTHCSILI